MADETVSERSTFSPPLGRIILYFVAVFAGIVLPVVGGLLLAAFGPEPYLMREDQLGPEWNVPRQFPDGSEVMVSAYPDAATARDTAAALVHSIPVRSKSKALHRYRYHRSDREAHGLVLAVGNRIVQVEAPEEPVVDARFASLPFVIENPQPGLLWVLFEHHLRAFGVGFALYTLLWGVLMLRGGGWAARIAPPGGTPPVAAEVLSARLRAINALDVPFKVHEEAGRLVAEWRISDARWTRRLEAGGLKMTHRVRMALDPATHKVRVQDTVRTLSWRAGVGSVGWSFSSFRGISFVQCTRGVAVGLLFKDGTWAVTPAYNYRFDVTEMKNPLIEVIVQSGWTFNPVVTFFRPLGG
jgi:hypothetical protein